MQKKRGARKVPQRPFEVLFSVSALKLAGAHCRASNYWVSGFPGPPKMVMETHILEQGFGQDTQDCQVNGQP